MGKHYTQIDIDERYELYRLHEAGITQGKIAMMLDRSTSPITASWKTNLASPPISVTPMRRDDVD